MRYLRQAFDLVCDEQKTPEYWYVCLVDHVRAYGGPEEGGWFYSVRTLEAYQQFPTRELAEEAAEKIKVLAEELSRDAQRSHGEYCLRQLEWLDARGLDADWLPENDGPSQFEVLVTEEIPMFDNHKPQWC